MRELKVPGKINHVRISVLAAAEPRGDLDNALEKRSVVENITVWWKE